MAKIIKFITKEDAEKIKKFSEMAKLIYESVYGTLSSKKIDKKELKKED